MAQIDLEPEDDDSAEGEGVDQVDGAGGMGLSDGMPLEWGDGFDLEQLCDTLQGLPPADAEEEVRTALRKSGADSSDANTLGVLLKVFRRSRDAALEGYEPWDVAVAYCDQLTKLCDRNFITGQDSANPQDFPATIVATVYAECGRTLALSEHLGQARNRLQQALNVFAIVPDGGDETVREQAAETRASLARVLRRAGHHEAALSEYLQALRIYAELPPSGNLAGFIGEFCELLGELGEDSFSSAMPSLLADLAEEKLEEGSAEHLRALRDIADACIGVGKLGLAAPCLAARARFLRSQIGRRASSGKGARRSPGALEEAETAAAEEEAAQALESAVAMRLEERDLAGAAAAWAEALEFRTRLEGPGSELVTAMRASLAALEQAVAAAKAGELGTAEKSEQSADEPKANFQQDEPSDPKETQETEKAVKPQAKERPAAGYPSLSSAAAPSLGLRPGWAREQPTRLAPARSQVVRAQPVDDGWDA